MSVDRSSFLTDDHDFKNPKPTKERSFAPDQGLIDQRFKTLKDEVLPFYPFLLTIPTDVPFRLGSNFVDNWAVGNNGPFTVDEHQLQYMTFLTHHEGDSLLVAVGDWSDGTGNIMTDQRPGLQTSTPSSGSVKKKISLNDYKNKWKSGTSASPTSREATSQSAPTLDDKQPASKANSYQQSNRRTSNTVTLSKSSSESAARKRPPDVEREHVRYNGGKYSEEHSPKKPRLSPDQTVNNNSDKSKTNGLPALLSPTLPPASDNPSLPQLLSPTLPPSIEKELASIHDEPLVQDSLHRGASSFDRLTTDAARVTPSNLDSPDSPISKSLQSKFPDSGMDRPASNVHGSTGAESSVNPKSNIITQLSKKSPYSKVASNVYTPPERINSHAISARQQLTIKLKYGRQNRKRVEALLKFSGKRKVPAPRSPVKGPSDRETTQSKKEGQNNPRSQNIAASEIPPTPSSFHSQQGKSKQITSGKDVKPTPSQSTSSDGKTPKSLVGDSGGVAKSSPPINSQTSRSRDCERRPWKDEYQKYTNLGRELKHASRRHTSKDEVTAADEKIAAATDLEAILCFILAFVADDQSKALARLIGDSSSWRSIIAYWRLVMKNSAPYPQLYSLCLILGAVSYDAIHALDLDRLAISPFPEEHTPVSASTSDGSPVLEEHKKNKKEFLELKARLPESYKESQKLWAEGTRGLSEETLGREFPVTWKNRSRRYSEQGKQPLKPSDFSGEYFLPLGRIDTPVEIARFGCSILNEWCGKEGLHWRGRLIL